MENLNVYSSPHRASSRTTQSVMLHVIIALIPAIVAATIIYGFRALMLVLVTTASAVVWEALCCIVMKKKTTIDDLSAVVTGILLALNLPATLPFWMAAIGSFVAICIVKELFGGLGKNFANPAIVGRIVLMLSFTSAMTNWVQPFYYKDADAVATATPLVTKSEGYLDLLLGNCGGTIGEVCALAILIGGIYLVAVKVISPVTPIAFLGSVMIFSFLVGEDPVYQILSGGVMLGAVFMATDYVTTPVTKLGKLIFGLGCGIITCVIRFYCSMAEGVSFAILFMNIVTPFIDMATKSRPFGAKKAEKKAGGADD
ncbi:MAG: RnfABCDGE type electron transport complex subunit D [Ruminococcus sp.]|nr:RnfABCDGE type electron transport complex subunit D [Ruminococcus sp.]